MPLRPTVFKHNLRSVLSASSIPQLERFLQSKQTKTGERENGMFRQCAMSDVFVDARTGIFVKLTAVPATVDLAF